MPWAVPIVSSTEVTLAKAGAAGEAEMFANTDLAAAVLRVKVRFGVVVAAETFVVKSGERLPAEKLVTVPDVTAEQVSTPDALIAVAAVPPPQLEPPY